MDQHETVERFLNWVSQNYQQSVCDFTAVWLRENPPATERDLWAALNKACAQSTSGDRSSFNFAAIRFDY